MDRAMIVGMLKDWGIAFAITLLILVGWRALSPKPASEGLAPALHAANVNGTAFALEDQHAEAYVINFWATWCAPCRQEIPEFSRFADANPGVEVYGVSVDEMNPGQLAAQARKLGIRYPVLHDDDGRIASTWGVHSFPTTFVLDADRRIVHVQVGMMSGQALEAAVAKTR